ncbi:23S rRNA (uracil(1939)-C(5))-methyltransferase RlmD [Clostridium sp. 'White wine YQ']|uniref:23S rRNA (uracil(1939)-C(5))-methyltransferase RlmD n=1 Tax=Clostridium sp. 'White wine YQ' TaxID=3027474 RepID=UPI002365CE9A|nr:23S rRNA (uracil(1939)-C(5))-methyltransferase RlmD [Clostridium sp. 'White wine YQ']MDD7795619.1 23S rRNA (uracil(1939)-C(5))-methyltransferase RlmD [Clostridium sp. 'White wine YQ']
MVEKNKEYILEVVSQGYEGEGIAKVDGFPIFVEGALKGEKIKVLVIKVKKTYAFGKLLEILEPSEDRETPICPIYKRCGGCTLQHMKYRGQLDFKKDRVKDCVSKIGKLSEDLVLDTIGAEYPYRYRNKVQLPVGLINGEIHIGFYAPRSHDIIDLKDCYIQDEAADKVVALTKEWMKKYNIQPATIDGKYNPKGVLRHIMIRKGFKTGEVMIVPVTNSVEIPYKKEFIEVMKNNIEGLTSIVQNINDKETNVILGMRNNTLWGKDVITDYIGDFKFNISPLSFFQVNPMQTETLYSKALEFAELTGEEVVFDAYCGTGTITLFLSQKAKKVYGVEIVPQAIDDAWKNAKENNVENVEFFVGESETVIPELISKGVMADVVVVDPPRKGCEQSLLEAIANISPKRIVYVSCDPSTLARDLRILDDMGYSTKKVQPVDMFPQTAHVETVALITRKDK